MRTQPPPLKRKARALARRVAVELLARTDRPDDSAAPQGDIILLLHHMPDPFLDKMDEVVAMMSEIAEPASYSEICSTPSDTPRFTVTFDDGNLSQMKAAERLADAGVSACFFIIAKALDADEAETARICRDELWMDPTPFMVRADLDRLLSMGHEVGSHTVGHLNLAQISDDEMAHQIGGSREQLAPWMADSPHFAWPFGGPGDFTKRAYDLVSDAGYVSCATAMRGLGSWRPAAGGIPLTFRQSVNLEDSLAVQRRFILNSEQHVAPSTEALQYLN
ncbi:MAG: polysaccharide deacetylase family protein [Acidimicrobiales bacterium]